MLRRFVTCGVALTMIASAVWLCSCDKGETKRKHTIATQMVMLEALQAYYDNNNNYPPEDTDGSDDCSELITELMSDADANELLKGLSSEACAGGSNTPLLDAYGNPMRYRRSGGLGGAPVLISAGKDGEFGFGPDDDPDQKLDNIRSDGR